MGKSKQAKTTKKNGKEIIIKKSRKPQKIVSQRIELEVPTVEDFLDEDNQLILQRIYNFNNLAYDSNLESFLINLGGPEFFKEVCAKLTFAQNSEYLTAYVDPEAENLSKVLTGPYKINVAFDIILDVNIANIWIACVIEGILLATYRLSSNGNEKISSRSQLLDGSIINSFVRMNVSSFDEGKRVTYHLLKFIFVEKNLGNKLTSTERDIIADQLFSFYKPAILGRYLLDQGN